MRFQSRLHGFNRLALLVLASIVVVAAPFAWRGAQVAPSIQGVAAARALAEDEHPFSRRVPAPSLDGGVAWINTPGPIDLKSLRGKFVVIDFWTYCCINCMHVLPELKKLEHAYSKEIVVIGVHSAKFESEQDTQNITDAVERYGIEHPVINDARHILWDKYGCQSWPSFRVIDPEGNIVAGDSGELTFEMMDTFFKRALPYYRKKGVLNTRPLKLEKTTGPPITPLRFPGKILADEKNDRLFIADSSHNRLVVSKLDGTLLDVIGSGRIGAADGAYDSAQFDHPQGLALSGETLYVADTENHLLRKVDLATKQVNTIAGTRKQAHPTTIGTMKQWGGKPAVTALSSPWALAIHGGQLYIAMAGLHQIWKMPLDESAIAPYAGNCSEDIVDGPLLPRLPGEPGFASFAQPSGLSAGERGLYVADSEGSSIRVVPYSLKENVRTVLGTSELFSARLFTFGDVDGPLSHARLQHCLDVLDHDGRLFIADTYNNKIKVIDRDAKTVVTFSGTGKPGAADSPAEFREPAGLTYAAGKLYVADTNNHAIRLVDLKTQEVSTLEIKGLSPPGAEDKTIDKPSFPDAAEVQLKSLLVRPTGDKVRLEVELELPEGWEINPEAPLQYLVEPIAKTGVVDRSELGKLTKVAQPATTFAIDLPLSKTKGGDSLKISLSYYYCLHGPNGVCKTGNVIWKAPFRVSADAKSEVVPLRHTVE